MILMKEVYILTETIIQPGTRVYILTIIQLGTEHFSTWYKSIFQPGTRVFYNRILQPDYNTTWYKSIFQPGTRVQW